MVRKAMSGRGELLRDEGFNTLHRYYKAEIGRQQKRWMVVGLAVGLLLGLLAGRAGGEDQPEAGLDQPRDGPPGEERPEQGPHDNRVCLVLGKEAARAAGDRKRAQWVYRQACRWVEENVIRSSGPLAGARGGSKKAEPVRPCLRVELVGEEFPGRCAGSKGAGCLDFPTQTLYLRRWGDDLLAQAVIMLGVMQRVTPEEVLEASGEIVQRARRVHPVDVEKLQEEK